MNEKKRACLLIIIPIILILSILSSVAFFPPIKSYAIQQEQVSQTWLPIHPLLGEKKSLTNLNPTDMQRNESNSNRFAIINFDDGFKNQFKFAKPILDEYKFNATFFIVCDYVDKKNRMNWHEIQSLYNDGYDVEAHSMSHKDLNAMSQKDLNYEISQSKQCLLDKGIDSSIFAYPRASSSDNSTVVNEVAKYYDLARTGFSPNTFLKCDGWKQNSSQKDCRTYFDNGTMTFANQYSLRGWMHERVLNDNYRFENNSMGNDNFNNYNQSGDYYGNYSKDNSRTFNNFIKVVNSQEKYNSNEKGINAIPIITYHNLVNGTVPFEKGDLPIATDTKLFEQEMKYLHDNHFNIIDLRDIGYNPDTQNLYKD